MKELNYKRAWTEMIHPKYLELPEPIRLIFNQTTGESDNMGQAHKTLETIGASADLIAKFDTIEPEQLAIASEIIYWLGHLATDRIWNNKGQYWKFKSLAEQSLTKRNAWEAMRGAKNQISDEIDRFKEHKAGSSYDDEEVAEILKSEVVLNCFTVDSCRAVNFKPHPFVIGPGHLKGDSMYLDPNSHGCYYRGRDTASGTCGLPYSAHTHETVVFLRIITPIEAKPDGNFSLSDEMKAELVACKDILDKYKIKVDGFGFIK